MERCIVCWENYRKIIEATYYCHEFGMRRPMCSDHASHCAEDGHTNSAITRTDIGNDPV